MANVENKSTISNVESDKMKENDTSNNHLHDHDDHEEHHVHFDSKFISDDFEEDNSVAFQKVADDVIAIHLGFLQVQHRYLIELKLPAELFKNNDIHLAQDEKIIPNLHCKLVEFYGKELDNDLHYFCAKIEFFAHKEKLLKENLILTDEHTGDKFKLIFNARVLGRGKGTPMLRNGIHCIHVEADEESEASDWKGFAHDH